MTAGFTNKKTVPTNPKIFGLNWFLRPAGSPKTATAPQISGLPVRYHSGSQCVTVSDMSTKHSSCLPGCIMYHFEYKTVLKCLNS
ncbi:hypothetical protein B0H12DRAFT_1100522 [Mycena haematopus]|nr:hypothetical protein B0H12DRAFT_1127043 [Mycena haematopus]KAJ7265376.1 hypothetical protein B0H12DRAFT_1100522 [Mycena haematopus]